MKVKIVRELVGYRYETRIERHERPRCEWFALFVDDRFEDGVPCYFNCNEIRL